MFSLYFLWHAHARISGVRRTKHVLPNERSVIASNSFHRQCLQLQPFCRVCGASFNKNSKKKSFQWPPCSHPRLFWVNSAEDNTEWSPVNICQGSHYIILLFVLGLEDLAGLDSPEVLKGFHKTGSMRASFYICVQGTHYNSKMHFLGNTLRKNAPFLS